MDLLLHPGLPTGTAKLRQAAEKKPLTPARLDAFRPVTQPHPPVPAPSAGGQGGASLDAPNNLVALLAEQQRLAAQFAAPQAAKPISVPLPSAEEQAENIERVFMPAMLATGIGLPAIADIHGWAAYRERFLARNGGAGDDIERMLLDQLLLAYLRAGQLQASVAEARGIEVLRLYYAALTRMIGEVRKLSLTLQEYRERRNSPRRRSKLHRRKNHGPANPEKIEQRTDKQSPADAHPEPQDGCGRQGKSAEAQGPDSGGPGAAPPDSASASTLGAGNGPKDTSRQESGCAERQAAAARG